MTENQNNQDSPPSPTNTIPQAPSPQEQGPRFFAWIRSLGIRRGQSRWVGGVCSGLAEKWNIDPVIVRGLAIVLTLFFGIGLLAYGVAWALLPEPDDRIHAEEVTRGRWSTGTTGAAITICFGLAGPGQSLAWGEHGGQGPWGLLWLIAPAAVIFWAIRRSKDGSPEDRQAARQAGKAAGQAAAQTAKQAARQATRQATDEALDAGRKSYSRNWQNWNWQDPDPRLQGSSVPVQAYGPDGPTGPLGSPATIQDRAIKHRNRLGAPTTLLSFGLAVIVGAVVLLLDRASVINLQGYAFAAAVAASAITLGLAIIVSGFGGKTAGGLGTLAVIALIVAGVSSINHFDFNHDRFGNQAWSPRSVAEAETGFSASFGKSALDLTHIGTDTPLTRTVTIPINVVTSEVTIKVPNSIPVSIDSDLAASNLTVEGSSGSTDNGGELSSVTQVNPKATGKGLTIKLDGAATDVRIVPTPAPSQSPTPVPGK